MGFPGSSVVKNLPANAGDAGLIPGSGRSLEEDRAAHPSIAAWRIPMGRGAWRATVHGVGYSEQSSTTACKAQVQGRLSAEPSLACSLCISHSSCFCFVNCFVCIFLLTRL